MITEQTLKKDVLQHLRKNYSIKLELPSLKRHISDKINLKLFKSPLGQELRENRYRLLINISEQLLKKNIINTEKIKQFGEQFFETINQDLLVMQNNEEIRRNFTRIRDQITYRIEELSVEQKKIEEECRSINDKENILIFLEGIFKNYLSNVKVVSEHYDAVNNVQVYTSINIDNIYTERLAQEEDYVQHFQPLLEVMQRLKTNMIKLYQELNRCEYYELPLKSVNFLANCKNLLIELEPFLIKPDCVFNRLIFHVTRGQKENNRLISKAFQSNIAFTNDIVSDIFKSFFLGHIFKDYFRKIKGDIESEKEELIKHFENKFTNSENFNHFSHKIEKNINEIRGEITSMKKIIGSGKDKIMREYLGRKQCKKSSLLMDMEANCNKLIIFSNTMQQLLRYKNRIQFLNEKQQQTDRFVAATINSLKELEQNNIKTKKPANSNIKQIQSKLEKKIKQSYLMIQDGLISIEQVSGLLKEARQQSTDPYFENSYYPKQQEQLDEMVSKYNDLQVTLLNSYQNLRKEKMHKTEQTKQTKSKIFQQLNDYFENKISGAMGYDIRNEDQQCQEIKDNIIKIEKMEFMMHNYLNSKNQEELDELMKYKINLEWLLQVFQGSMDEKIFENFLEKLNFEVQDWREKANKVKELIKELIRYVNILKTIIKSNNIGKINQKVYKLIKNRIQLYEILQDMYQEFILIYESCKSNTHLNISDHGLKLFDEPTYKYVLMLYQYKNRMRAEIQEIKDLLLPKKTINYLLDELYEPFLQIFNHFVTYSEEELLNFTLRLEHALNFKLSHPEIIRLFEQTLSKPYSKGFFANVRKICQQLLQLRKQNAKVLDLEEQEVMIYNLSDFKDKTELIQEHLTMADTIIKELNKKTLVLDLEFKNIALQVLRDKLTREWEQHREEASRSLSVSRAEDFSQHNDL